MPAKRLRVVVSVCCEVSHDEAVALIKAGRVMINGTPGALSDLVEMTDRVTLDGNEISAAVPMVYVLFHKPRGTECTMNPEIPENLLTVFHYPHRLFPVGRLDKESEGLLLMTNDGRLYHKVAHAGNKQEKEYYVELNRPFTGEFIDTMKNGVGILNTTTDPCDVFPIAEKPNAFRIILRQGMNRQIRRMCHNLGYSVHKLVRTRIMHMQLGNLKAGEWRTLSDEELQVLKITGA